MKYRVWNGENLDFVEISTDDIFLIDDMTDVLATTIMDWRISGREHGVRLYSVKPNGVASHWSPFLRIEQAWGMIERLISRDHGYHFSIYLMPTDEKNEYPLWDIRINKSGVGRFGCREFGRAEFLISLCLYKLAISEKVRMFGLAGE